MRTSQTIAAHFIALMLGASPSANSEILPIVTNNGFEIIEAAESKSQPSGWKRLGPPTGSAIVVQDIRAHSGNQSLRVNVPVDGFLAFEQSFDAREYRGRILALSGWIKSDGIRKGDVGLWVRAESATAGAGFFADTYDGVQKDTGDWEHHSLPFYVNSNVERIVFGFAATSSSAMFVDDVEVRDDSSVEPIVLSSSAKTFLDAAIREIRAQSYYGEAVKWSEMMPTLYRLAGGASTTNDTYPAIREALRSLGDNHSFLVTPKKMTAMKAAASGTSSPIIEALLIGDVGYLNIPGQASTSARTSQEFADAVGQKFAYLQSKAPCGWIVDLRANRGGSMHIVLAGIAPLFSDGEIGNFVGRDWKEPWAMRGGLFSTGTGEQGAALRSRYYKASPVDSKAPVAVLIGPRTASAGEAIAIAIKARGNTRSFGAPTSGQTTANRNVTLSDGAVMSLTTSLVADAAGTIYRGALQPDSKIAGGARLESFSGSADDSFYAAFKWVTEQKTCVR